MYLINFKLFKSQKIILKFYIKKNSKLQIEHGGQQAQYISLLVVIIRITSKKINLNIM
jgi:hypothetical protein